MPTLARYSDFKDLKKSDLLKHAANTDKALQISELETFLSLLRREKAKKQKNTKTSE